MENCPFCGEEVSKDLVIYGGTCPSCFAEIPGEEAPTNPGEEVIAQQVESDKRQAGIRPWVGLLLILMVVFGLTGMAVFVLLQPEPVVVVLDFDDFEDWDEPTIVGKEELAENSAGGGGTSDAAEEAAPAPRAVPTPRATPQVRERPVAPKAGPAPAPQQGSADDGPTLGRPRPSGGGIGIGGDLDVRQARRGEALSDPDAIRKSVGQNMSAQIPRLKACYDQRLKTEANLRGRWRIKFTITPDGRVKDAGAEGLNMKDGEFETCVARDVGRWKFDRMVREQPVQRTLRFEPQ